jgi:RimJ/RimL family protein N-acetyltransferase
VELTRHTGAVAEPGTTYLTTERMVLRWFEPADLDLLIALHNDAEVMHFIDNGSGESVAEVQEALDAFVAYTARSDGYGFWAAERAGTGEFLGWFHLRPHPGAPADDPELGYRLHRGVWGSGLGTEGSRALVDHAFSALGARRVHAETMVVHVASRRVMEKVGMRLVREFHADWPVRIPGDEHGDVEYAITRTEWEARRARSS